MAELVGGAFLSAFLQGAFDKLASRHVLDYFCGRKLNDTLLSKLNIKLLSINVVTDHAEQKQFSNSHVKAWLNEVRDAVLDAEDLLDEIHYEVSKSKLEAESESQTCACKVLNFFNASFSSFNRRIESRMKQVLDKLEYLASQKGDLGLNEASGVGSSSIVSQKLPSTSLPSESVIYGRDDDEEMIINWLMSDNENGNQLSIISIVGMGGLGKTTLAQHVYNDTRIEGKFDIQAWVCVSDEFDVFKVTRTILEATTKSTDDSRDLEMVQGRLKEKLTGRRFLLVLDDVWNESRDQWKALQSPLNCGAQGSRILVTTRSEKVASIMWTNKVNQLKQLQEDHCWQVFAKHAFQDDNPQLNAELKEIGIKIVEKCKGLPLALKTIGSLLYTKSCVLEWESVLISEIWDLPKEDSEIIPALLLSYHHLPSHLKRCFAYCALFPKDYLFDKENLILLWMAENFLQCPQQSKSPEEVGAQYFDDLLLRSFFQQSSEDTRHYVMHGLLNDMAKYVCGDIYFRLGVDKAKHIPKGTRHFSLVINQVRYFDGFGSLHDAQRLRTFMPLSGNLSSRGWHCKMSIHELFSKFMLLRVLSLSHCSNLIKVPDSLGNLKHLRSLNLSHTAIKKLPDSTCSLYNLQILKLSFCGNLEELPSNLHKLTNLCHLEFIDTDVRKVPVHLGKLKNLRVWMSSFSVGKSNELSIQQLGELNLHGSLKIGKLQYIENPSDALAMNLKNKAHLVELEFKWNWNNLNPDESTKEKEVLENLQPSKHLEILSISNYAGTQFPSWLFDNSLPNMVSLRLDNCKYCVQLPTLGLLPFLKHLTITGLDAIISIDAGFYGSSSSSFTSLETLRFFHMKKWEEWECKAMTGAFLCLRKLYIEQCPKLKGSLPDQLVHLKELYIRDCKQLVASAPRALERYLSQCGKLQIDYPTTLKSITMYPSSLKMIGRTISDTSLGSFSIYSGTNMNIPINGCYSFLVELKICGGCDSLTTFPLDFFPKLRLLDLRCRNLQMISQRHAHNHLNHLEIRGCPQFEFPREGLSAPRLEWFLIEGLENLKSLPERMDTLLPSLSSLRVKDCPQMESFSDGCFPSSLKNMDLWNCSKLMASLKGTVGANTSLETLSVTEVDVISFPDEGMLPLSLTSLSIRDCPLEQLDYKGLCHPSSLTELDLCNCCRLQRIPEDGLPESISILKIRGDCWLLKQRCQNPNGEDWGKIAHVEYVWIS